ncbi:MAG: NAD-dependent epimerase/dehydratase family protein [Candidatus Omnitrophica bacterium]|nr:NAD-dependent epimerase/dehydratase family protein [Candidatus Omnitrophota bacterium]MDD5652706.1 NAD-dependent epimerase/dehydratase family protein [Candidatus Omnitrophota bacterium]
MKNKNILVTGGAGAIGANLVNILSASNKNIIVIDDLSSGTPENILKNKNVVLYKDSILNDLLLKRIFLKSRNKIDIVFHLAALFANQNSVEHPEKDLLTNALGTLKLLDLSTKSRVERFVYISSSCVYGSAGVDLKEDLSFSLETPYAISKFCGEQYAHFYHHLYGLRAVILRYFNAFGPGDPPGRYRNVIPNFMLTALQGKPLKITGTGDETRDFTYIDDIIRGTILAAEVKNATGHIFNIGSGREIKIRHVAELINCLSGNKAGIKFIPRRKWDKITRRVANIEKSRKILGYRPQISFDDGLKKTYRWFKERYCKK